MRQKSINTTFQYDNSLSVEFEVDLSKIDFDKWRKEFPLASDEAIIAVETQIQKTEYREKELILRNRENKLDQLLN